MIEPIKLEVSSEQELINFMKVESAFYQVYSISRHFVKEHLAHWERGFAETGGGHDYLMVWKALASDQWIVIKISREATGYFDDLIDHKKTGVVWKYKRDLDMEQNADKKLDSFADTSWENIDEFTMLGTFDVVFLLHEETT